MAGTSEMLNGPSDWKLKRFSFVVKGTVLFDGKATKRQIDRLKEELEGSIRTSFVRHNLDLLELNID